MLWLVRCRWCVSFLLFFPKDNYDLPPGREVDFAIDFTPGTRLVSMAPYRVCIRVGQIEETVRRSA